MTKRTFWDIFLRSILPALITGGVTFFWGFKEGKSKNIKDSASIEIGGKGNNVKGAKAIKTNSTTIVETGDYVENSFDTSIYHFVKTQNDTLYLLLKH